MSKLAELEAIIKSITGMRGELRERTNVGGMTQSMAVTDADVSHRRALIAVTDGSRRYGCSHVFERSEVAFGARTTRPGFLGWGSQLKSYCERRVPKDRRNDFPHACVSCGRQVANQADYICRKRVICSPDCARRADIMACARRRAEKRRKTCATCGLEFIGTRADATTCSAACRQKAYRRRIARRGSTT